MISALPVSGAGHPNTIGAHCDRPRISLSSASLSCPYPCPPRSGLRCVPHNSRRRTSSFNGSTTFRRVSSSGVNASPGHTRSSGSTSSRTNESTQSSFSWNSGSVSKSHGIVLPLGNWSGRFDDDSDGVGPFSPATRNASAAPELDVHRGGGTDARRLHRDALTGARRIVDVDHRHAACVSAYRLHR